MKIHLDKDTGIISLLILIALLLVLSVFQGHAQGQSCKKVDAKKMQSMLDYYNLSLKNKCCISLPDSNNKNLKTKVNNSIRKIKKGVPSMLMAQNPEDGFYKKTTVNFTKPLIRNIYTYQDAMSMNR
jgi:hypothetical protein